jgi:hypothetical protein
MTGPDRGINQAERSDNKTRMTAPYFVPELSSYDPKLSRYDTNASADSKVCP